MARKRYVIDYAASAEDDLASMPLTSTSFVLDKIDKQLLLKPDQQTRNRKPLFGLAPPSLGIVPVWELRIGDFRVFYDIDVEGLVVTVQAIRLNRQTGQRRIFYGEDELVSSDLGVSG